MAFPLPPLNLDFGSTSSFQTSIDTAPISNEGFTGAFAVGSGASARTESQFSPQQTAERNAPGVSGMPMMGGSAFPMELVYIAGGVLLLAVVLKKVLK